MTYAIMLGVFVILLFLGAPIALSLGMSSLLAILYNGTGINVIAGQIYGGIGKYLLLAVPFFVLSGNIMAKAGISDRLIAFIDALLGHLRGGIAMVCVVVACFFGAISGSGAATVAALGVILIPAMIEREKFSDPFAHGVVAAASSIAVIIPPSISFVIYASLTGVSVGDIFVAGILPGVIMGVAMIIVVQIYAHKHHLKPAHPWKGWREVWRTFKSAFWGLLMPVIILGGIYGGVFSATEAAAVAAVYGLFVGTVIYKKLKWKDIGVEVEGVKVNFPQVIAHKNAISKQLTSGVAGLLKLNKVKKVDGTAKFTGEKQLEVTKPDGSKESMTADAIIVATGSVNAQPPIPGLKENPNCIDSTGALSLDKLPATMVVIGGGVIGLELACAYAAFGTKITVVEAMDHMLPMLDGDLTKIGVAHMKKMGMEFHLECPVQSVEDSPVGAKVVCKDKSGNTVSFEAEKVLVAIGRRANTAALDLAAGKIHNDKGRILVNDKMETSVPGVYAIGDCVFGHAQLAHTASAMGEVAAENICGHEAHYCEKTNPTCVYMEPEAASVGLTEEQCKAQGIAYKVGKFPMSANGKALILNGGEGLVKIIAGAEYGEILGMHIIGPRATDLIAEGALAIGGEMTLDELIDTIHSHPTVTETMREAALNAEKRAIHTKN